MTTAPYVELRFNPTDLRPGDLPRAGAFLGSPSEALEAALSVARAAVVERVKLEIAGLGVPTQAQMLRIADLAWQAVFWKYRKVSAPIIADAYLRAYQAAEAGDVPMSVLYSLADQHAEKVGEYFYTSSREALAEGFTTLVNRRVPAKAAADRVLDGFGLTPRQMRGYTAATTFDTPVASAVPRSLKAKAKAYIDKAFHGRIRKLAKQEQHNIEEQAKQYAWMWLQDHGRLNERAQKLWITARDERVCPVCGPLHNQRVGVNERFKTTKGEFWTPGLHPNCRCVVRLLEHRFSKSQVSKAQKWDARRHPRGGDPENPGRFSAIARTRSYQPVKEREPSRPVISGLLPIIEEQQAGPKEIGLEGPKEISLGGEITLDNEVSLAPREISMAPKEIGLGETEEKEIRAGEKRKKVRLSDEEIRAQIAMNVSPSMQIQMDNAIARTLELETEQFVPVAPPKRKLYARPIKAIMSDDQKPYAVYAVGNPVDAPVQAGGNLTNLNRDLVFTTNKSKVIAQANEDFEVGIASATNNIFDSDLHKIRKTTGTGDARRQWIAELDDDDVVSIVAWTAYQGRVPDSDWGGDQTYEIAWHSGGQEKIEEVHASQLAQMLHLNPKDFEVRILRLTEGHDSELGQTEQVTTKGRDDDWVTEGDYRMKRTRHPEETHRLKINVYQLDPDVDEVEIPSIFDD